MASVELPDSPGPRSLAWEPVDFGGTLQGPLGGAGQRVNRLGSRWRMRVDMPVLTPRQAREWSAALVKGLRLGVLMPILQPETSTGVPGSPLVAGAGQTGTDLDIDGLTPAYGYRIGQWVSVIVSSRRYLYQISASGFADTSGVATLPIEPPLRVSPADNDTVELGLPYIEGLLAEAPSWMLDVDRLARGFSFAIEETR
jgi:hypothetical protein